MPPTTLNSEEPDNSDGPTRKDKVGPGSYRGRLGSGTELLGYIPPAQK